MKRLTFIRSLCLIGLLFGITAPPRGARAGDVRVIVCEILTDARAIVPGARDLNGNPIVTHVKALEDFNVNDDGSQWILKGRNDGGSDIEGFLLIGSGVAGQMFAQEGQPFAGGVPNELYDFFDTLRPAAWDSANNIAFSARARGGVSGVAEKVVVVDAATMTHRIVLQQGDPAVELIDNPPQNSGDERIGNSIGSIFLRDDGQVGFVNTPIENCHSSRYPAFFLDNQGFRQSGVSRIEGFTWDTFGLSDAGGTPDAAHWYAEGEIEEGGDGDDRILAVDNRIALREGSQIGGSGVIVADIFDTRMAANGTWFSRGDDAQDLDWAVVNGNLVAKTGDEIGGSGEFLDDTFLALAGNRAGDWVLAANTSNPDALHDTVVLLNGEVVVREGDPIDLDGNGQFDDDVFIGRGDPSLSAFAANDFFLTDDRTLYFIAPLRDEAGNDLGSNPPFGTGGDALLVVELGQPCDPCDANCDGAVDAFDIEPFIGVVFEGDPPCGDCAGDVNGDGRRDAFDIEPFIACLFGP